MVMRITKPNEVGAMPPILQRFLVGTILLTMAALITKFVCANLLHLGPQYGYYFMPSRLRFVDFICFIPRFQRFHHADFFAPSHGLAFTYPAPNALIYQFFYFCFIHGIKVFVASCFFVRGSCWLCL